MSSVIYSVVVAAAMGAGSASGAQIVPAERVCSVVQGLISQAAGMQGIESKVDCVESRAIELADGKIEWLLAVNRPDFVAGAARFVLHASVGGRTRDVAVPVRLALASQAWVAHRSLRVGEEVDAQAIDKRLVQWPVGVVVRPATEYAPVGRAKRSVKEGDIVTADLLTSPTQRLQGDAVNLTVRSGAIQMRMPAVLVAGAAVGQVARVQPKGRNDTLEGVLLDAHTVLVER